MLSPSDKKVTETVCKQLNIPVEFIDWDRADVDPNISLGGLFEIVYTDGMWTIGRVDIIPGVRYRMDGSGEPDDAEFVEIATFTRYSDALGMALAHYAKFASDATFEDEAMYQDHLEMKRIEEEAAHF